MGKIFVLYLSFFVVYNLCAQQTTHLRADNIDEIITAMSLEEKVSMCVGIGSFWEVTDAEDGLPGAAGGSKAIPRMGVPTVYFADGPLGLKISETRAFDSYKYSCTSVPVPLLLASSWDKEAVYRIGKIIGNECLEYGVGVLLGPSFNIIRNPLGGRSHEYYSEDPFLAGKLAAAFVNGVQSMGVGACVKHFAANNQETNRAANDARVSQRALREIYLKAFEIAVKEAAPWTIMTSYNKINGKYTSENRELLQYILRDEWNFKGMVMSDWGGGTDPIKQLMSGNDMLQPGSEAQYNKIIIALQNGELTEETINTSVKRILEMVVRTPAFKGYKNSNSPDLKSHAQEIRRIAAESMILLKNENALPFNGVRNVALYGCTAYDVKPGGIGYKEFSGPNYVVSIVEGLRKAGLKEDRRLAKAYLDYLKADKQKVENEAKQKAGESLFSKLMVLAHVPEEMEVTDSMLNDQVRVNDIAIIVLGHNAGEAVDRSATDFKLTKKEIELIRKVSNAYSAAEKKTIVILNIPGPVETASWKELPDAILCTYQPGEQAGNSIADVLTGKINPSGKLTVTFPVLLEDNPSTSNFPLAGGSGISGMMMYVQGGMGVQGKKETLKENIDFTNYFEDIYVGYRYFDSFNKPVSYPFGFGLSYTEFNYRDAKVLHDDTGFRISITVTNVGKVKGREVVQVYVEAPRSDVEKPVQELKAFAKTRDLKPGESETLEMKVTHYDLAYFNEKKAAWITDKGIYKFKIGASSRDIKVTVDARLPERQLVKVNNVLNPEGKLNIMRQAAK